MTSLNPLTLTALVAAFLLPVAGHTRTSGCEHHGTTYSKSAANGSESAPDAGAPDEKSSNLPFGPVWEKFVFPGGLTAEQVIESVRVISEWELSEDPDPVHLTIRLFQILNRSQSSKGPE